MRITCALVDLRYVPASDLSKYPVLIVPPSPVSAPQISRVQNLLRTYRARGGRIVSSAREAHIPRPSAGGIPNAALLVSGDERFGFLDVVNYGRSSLHTKPSTVHYGRFNATIPALTV